MMTTLDPAIQARPRLRPMGVADTLDAAVHLYRHNFVKLAITAALLVVPLSACQAAAQIAFMLPMLEQSTPAGEASNWVLVGQAVSVLTAFIGAAITYGITIPALVWLAGQRYLDQAATVTAAYQAALRRLPVTAGALFLYLGLAISVGLFGLLPCIGWTTGLPLWLFMSVNMLALLAPVVMLENGGVLASLQRCWQLTKHNFWRAFGLVVAMYFFSSFITAGPSLLGTLVIVSFYENLPVGAAISAGVSALMATVSMPLWGIALTLLYYDTRIRCEALDLQLLAQVKLAPLEHGERFVLIEKNDWTTLIVLAGLTFLPFLLFGLLYMLLIGLAFILGAAN